MGRERNVALPQPILVARMQVEKLLVEVRIVFRTYRISYSLAGNGYNPQTLFFVME